MSSIIGEKNSRKLEDKLDIKNFIKLQKKVYLISKILFSSDSKFMFKLLTKTYKDKYHFRRYFIKKSEKYKVNLDPSI